MRIDDLEKQLNNLPKGQLSKERDRVLQEIIKGHGQKPEKTPWLTFGWVLKRTAVGVCAVMLLFVGVGTYAYHSDQVTVDKGLYGLKISLENLRLKKAGDSSEKATVHADFAQRRLTEAEILAYRNGESLTSYLIKTAHAAEIEDGETMNTPLLLTMDKYNFHNRRSLEHAQEIKEVTKLKKVLVVLEKRQKENKDRVGRIAKRVGIKAAEPLVDTIVVALVETEQASTNVDTALQEVTVHERETASHAFAVKPKRQLAVRLVPHITSTSQQVAPERASEETQVVKTELEAFAARLKTQPTETPETETYIRRLERKIKAAEQALEEGNTQEMQAIARSSKALKESADVYVAKPATATRLAQNVPAPEETLPMAPTEAPAAPSADVPIEEPGEESAKPFPQIKEISPAQGAPGTLVTIRGTNFRDGCKAGFYCIKTVRFGRQTVSDLTPNPIESWSDTEIRVRLPQGATTAAIKINYYYDPDGPGTGPADTYEIIGPTFTVINTNEYEEPDNTTPEQEPPGQNLPIEQEIIREPKDEPQNELNNNTGNNTIIPRNSNF